MKPATKRWTTRFLGAIALVLSVLAIAGFTYEQLGRSRDRSHPFRIGDGIDVGGRTINIDCAGTGSPTVILEAGGGGRGGYGWRTVQSGVAKFTKVCWYDRAGEGWSDSAPSVRNSSMVVNDLHEVLQRIQTHGPIVLVGHSIGGEYIRIYTARFPTEVVGLVLVDSTHPDQREPAIMLSPVSRMPSLVRRAACALVPLASRFGLIRFLMRNTIVEVPAEFTDRSTEAIQAWRGQLVKGFQTEAFQGCAATGGGSIQPESGSGDPEVDGVARRAGSLGARPLVVLTAGEYWKPANDPVAVRQVSEFHQVWVKELQTSLARLSTEGNQVVVENSGHGIPEEAPEAVITAVYEVVEKARATR